jgi:hypothetical protein
MVKDVRGAAERCARLCRCRERDRPMLRFHWF